MPGFTEAEARTLLERVLTLSRAETCEASLYASAGGNMRYARNEATTSGATDDRALYVQSNFGLRAGTASINELDDTSIERVVRRSEELARLAPEDPEFVSPLGPQRYLETNCYVAATAAIAPEDRARVAAIAIKAAKGKGGVAAGFQEDRATWQSLMNSSGLFAYHKATNLNFNLTVRSGDGTGSGYVSRDFNDVGRFDPAGAAAIAIEKAIASRKPRVIEPGKYTVILEPEASADLILSMIFGMDARPADEGQSFLARAGGGSKVGEKLLDAQVTITSDPANPDAPTSPWSYDGRPNEPVAWFEEGVVKNLYYSRYWAAKQGKTAVPAPANVIMKGGSASIEELVRGTARGLLVSRSYYVRQVDPQTLLSTGLTRDGTFYIENGKIQHAVKNMRWNESPILMLSGVEALGIPERVIGEYGVPSLIPPMRLREFTFTSSSDAV
jgi:predicted Zn-dependent protease